MPNETLPLFGQEYAELSAENAADNTTAVVSCPCCNAEIPEGDGIQHDGETHCQDCVHTCEGCEYTTIDGGELNSAGTNGDCSHRSSRQNHRILCNDCSFQCDDCNEWFDNDIDNRTNANDRRICGSCSEHYFSCESCNCVLHEDDTFSTDDGTYCQSCHDERADDAIIHQYSYKPDPFFQSLEGEKRTRRTLYLGIEVEVDHTQRRDREDDAIDSGLQDHNTLYCKEDGSLDRGFEIVSHPATWEFWKTFNWDFTTKLKSMGYRSYDTTTCGMHVHASKAALSDLDRFKLLAFFRTNRQFITRLSRRQGNALEQWARIDGGCNKALIKKVKDGPPQRYEAINLLPRKTVEFRIFRGTLDAKAIERNIALVYALCRFVQSVGIREMWAKDFVKWLRQDGRSTIGRPQAKELLTWILTRSPESNTEPS